MTIDSETREHAAALDLFEGSVQDAQSRLAGVFARIPVLFEHGLAMRLFMSIGPPEPDGGLPLPPDAAIAR